MHAIAGSTREDRCRPAATDAPLARVNFSKDRFIEQHPMYFQIRAQTRLTLCDVS